ncbi:MAG: hypothetical protein QXX40_02230 [Sulfolobales archaeon]
MLVGIDVSFTFSADAWSTTLTVHFYRAGRDDRIYTTPCVSVKDVGRSSIPWYYWWCRDEKPMLYEIQFSNNR